VAGGPVAGIDGCRGGWLVAMLPAGAPGHGADVRVHPDLSEVAEALRSGRLVAAAIDIPIGLPAEGSRVCDREARRLLGPRRSSVFPAPVRAVLGTSSYAEACAVSRAVSGKALSKQLYNIVGKIRAVDRLESPRLQHRLFEACPELSFALMADGRPMRHPKRSAEGRTERVRLLEQEPGLGPVDSAPPAGAGPDDVLDALALAWTARRYVDGSCLRLGGQLDETGLRMEVVA
jgi:predicted RNase H-like nuclease